MEMPALDITMMDATADRGMDPDEPDLESADESSADRGPAGKAGKKKKLTKAEKSEERAAGVAAAINAGTDPLDAMADELPSPGLR